MNIDDSANDLNRRNSKKKLLKTQVREVFVAQDLTDSRRLIRAVAAELKISVLDCAAALVLLSENRHPATHDNVNQQPAKAGTPFPAVVSANVKLVRYRLDLGRQHQLHEAVLKKVLVEESGVDIKNIANIRIQDAYTLIDLPDEMPQDIFNHLKLVEINGQKLDIRRVKPRNKRRHNHRQRLQQRDQQIQAAK